jgi:hypothetical protein
MYSAMTKIDLSYPCPYIQTVGGDTEMAHKVSAGYRNQVKQTELAIKRGQKARKNFLARIASNDHQISQSFKSDELHEISCCYSGGPGEPYYQAVMSCSCGFRTERCLTWQEAGEEMDAHIEEIRE